MLRYRLLLCLLLPASSAIANEQAELTYYPITGNSVRELLAAMAERGPAGDDGKRFHGYTTWRVGWSFDTSIRDGQCRIDQVRTEVKGNITLPEWQDIDRANAPLRERWQRYSERLREHEEGHFQFARSAAADVRQQLAGLTSAEGCRAVGQQANQLGRDILRGYQQRERAYDRDTQHGRTQGAVL